MNSLEPLSVVLKFGFLTVLYVFLLWVARSARRDLGGGASFLAGGEGGPGAHPPVVPPDATGLYSASSVGSVDLLGRAPKLVVERAPGHEPGMIYDLGGDITLGRGERVEIRLEDPFASASHARIYEDLASTNGTYLNEELLQTPRPLHPGDRLRIGDSEFAFEVD